MNFSKLLQANFKWGGRDLETGLDCYGLACEARKIIFPDRAPLPEYPDICVAHDRDSMPRTLLQELFRSSNRAHKVSNAELGDLVLVLGRKGIAIVTYLGDVDGCERVLGFGASERPELIPRGAVRVSSYWRVSDAPY
jgi:hypothetical protein